VYDFNEIKNYPANFGFFVQVYSGIGLMHINQKLYLTWLITSHRFIKGSKKVMSKQSSRDKKHNKKPLG
jgi:hypothetical protein